MSKSKRKNPYRKGSYHEIFDFIQTEQIVTRPQLMEKFPASDVTVVLSPREKDASRGDPRGNMSARGEVYYMDRLKKKSGEPQRFRLRWRKEPLSKRGRPLKKEVAAQKTRKAGSTKVEASKASGKSSKAIA